MTTMTHTDYIQAERRMLETSHDPKKGPRRHRPAVIDTPQGTSIMLGRRTMMMFSRLWQQTIARDLSTDEGQGCQLRVGINSKYCVEISAVACHGDVILSNTVDVQRAPEGLRHVLGQYLKHEECVDYWVTPATHCDDLEWNMGDVIRALSSEYAAWGAVDFIRGPKGTECYFRVQSVDNVPMMRVKLSRPKGSGYDELLDLTEDLEELWKDGKKQKVGLAPEHMSVIIGDVFDEVHYTRGVTQAGGALSFNNTSGNGIRFFTDLSWFVDDGLDGIALEQQGDTVKTEPIDMDDGITLPTPPAGSPDALAQDHHIVSDCTRRFLLAVGELGFTDEEWATVKEDLQMTGEW